MSDINQLSLANAALYYAARGWPVFPCVKRGKRPLTPNGFKDATTDVAQIETWWSRWPEANIGIPTGKATFDVLDIDGEAGERWLYDHELVHGELPRGPRQNTGKGRHILFQGGSLPTSARRRPGVDTRGEGGYVVMAPSIHESGIAYRMTDPDFDLPTMPDTLPAEITAKRAPTNDDEPSGTPVVFDDGIAETMLRMAGFDLMSIAAGGRNATLASKGGWMRAQDHDERTICNLLLLANKHLCKPPLPEAEVRTIARSVSRYEVDHETKLAAIRAKKVLDKSARAIEKDIEKSTGKAEENEIANLAASDDLDEVRQMIFKQTGCYITRVVQIGRDFAQFYLEIPNHPTRIPVGPSLMNARAIREALHKHASMVAFPPLKSKRWESVLVGMTRLIDIYDDEESTRKGETLGWVNTYLAKERTSRQGDEMDDGEMGKTYVVVSNRRAFIEEGVFYLSATSLLASLRVSGMAPTLSLIPLVERLQEVGFAKSGPKKKGIVTAYDPELGQVGNVYWSIPLEALAMPEE